MKATRITLGLILLISSRVLAQTNGSPLRLAIVAQESSAIAAADLLTVELSRKERITLLGQEPQSVFSGPSRKISLVLSNSSGTTTEFVAVTRLIQTSSTTTIRLGEAPWKTLRVLPGQTILESARLDFPEVRAETRFLVQWLEGTNHVFGTTEVLVYPTNLLAELKSLAGEDEGLGVFDPSKQLKPLLAGLKIGFVDLEDVGVESFHGKLALVGPFASKSQMREGLSNQIRMLAAKDVAVVWLQPPPGQHDKLQPSYFAVTEGPGSVVVVQADLVSNLTESPRAQLNLIHCARLALRPEPLRLPNPTTQP